jgi:hypothetical protein
MPFLKLGSPNVTLPLLSESLPYLDADFRKQMLFENPCKMFLMIRTLEIAIEAGMTPQILEAGYTEKGVEQLYQHCGDFLLYGKSDAQKRLEVGRQFVVSYTKAEWSAIFARDKLMLCDLGLVSAKDGDLRKAKLLSSSEQALNLLKWKQFRERPETIAHIIIPLVKKGDTYGRKFFRRLGELVEKPSKDFLDYLPQLMESKHRQLQMFLLDNWAKEWSVTVYEPPQKPELPPLYTFKNKALFDFLYELANKASELKRCTRYQAVQEMDENSLGMIWRRLGLRRPDTGIWGHVEWERNRRTLMTAKRLVIWDQKPSSGI